MLNVADFGTSQILDRDVSEAILLRHSPEDSIIFATLLAAGRRRETMTPKIEWLTDGQPARRTAVNRPADNYDDTTTAILVDEPSVFTAGDLVLAEATGEVMLCTSVVANTINVVRGVGGGVAAATASVADNANLMNIGPAIGEGQASRVAVQSLPTRGTSYTQIFRESVELSGTAANTATHGGDQRAHQRMKKFRQQQQSIERAFIYGSAGEAAADADGKIVRTTGGLLNAITTHVDDIAGNLTFNRLMQFFEMAFQYGSSEKILFAGLSLETKIHQLFDSKLRVEPMNSEVGIQIARIKGPGGVLNLVGARGLTGDYANHGIVVDPLEAAVRPLQGNDYKGNPRGDLHLIEDIQPEGTDAVKDEWYAELGLEWGNEQNHAVIKGATGVA